MAGSGELLVTAHHDVITDFQLFRRVRFVRKRPTPLVRIFADRRRRLDILSTILTEASLPNELVEQTVTLAHVTGHFQPLILEDPLRRNDAAMAALQNAGFPETRRLLVRQTLDVFDELLPEMVDLVVVGEFRREKDVAYPALLKILLLTGDVTSTSVG